MIQVSSEFLAGGQNKDESTIFTTLGTYSKYEKSFLLHSFFLGSFLLDAWASKALITSILQLKTQFPKGQPRRSWACSWHSVLSGILYINSNKFFSIIFFIIFVHKPSTFSTSIVLSPQRLTVVLKYPFS